MSHYLVTKLINVIDNNFPKTRIYYRYFMPLSRYFGAIDRATQGPDIWAGWAGIIAATNKHALPHPNRGAALSRFTLYSYVY